MLSVTPYLNFKGNCRAALDVYVRVLGAKLEFVQTFGESPMDAQAGGVTKDQIIHARLNIGGTVVMASDAPADKYETPRGMMLSVNVDDAKDADRIFGELSSGGSVSMPIQETFWAERFGMCVDRFGTPWMVNCMKAMAEATG